EPFSPDEALPKSGEFLAELRREFGNLGLAAAAYNAGSQRVHDFLFGNQELPSETRNYVLAVTGRSIESWATRVNVEFAARQKVQIQSGGSGRSCDDLVALLEKMPAPPSGRWRGKKFPSWCKGLRHPDVDVCGPVRLIEPMPQLSDVHPFESGLR
ncbi:MAG TPA: lytic transglycosylase domain-containing protein, partial [Xanthobacteraceae bacterium]|nr:lytic transglycosylase domain-containing protein [Xanthobacteraceae bacterium]